MDEGQNFFLRPNALDGSEAVCDRRLGLKQLRIGPRCGSHTHFEPQLRRS